MEKGEMAKEEEVKAEEAAVVVVKETKGVGGVRFWAPAGAPVEGDSGSPDLNKTYPLLLLDYQGRLLTVHSVWEYMEGVAAVRKDGRNWEGGGEMRNK